ncbi:dipeptidase [Sorangium sp. So ce1000]|uniref:dipeptidase n=1 Tax=Sorangium sp. So ce1000 TaxID=3133325 RepID=UPI003F6094B5
MRTSLSLALLAAASLAACVRSPAPAAAPELFARPVDEVGPWYSVASGAEESPAGPETFEQRAARLRAKAILMDGHSGVPSLGHSGVPSLPLGGSFARVSPDDELADAELARIKAAGVTAAFFPIQVSASASLSPSQLGYSAARRALDLIDATHRQIERHHETLILARTAKDVRRAERERKIAVIMGIEGGHAIENSLPALRSFYRLGVRTMALTHTTTNDWAGSAGGALDSGYVRDRGLSPFGEAVVREMQRLGMLVDVSHASDSTFQGVMKVAKAPIITSSTMPAAGHHRRDLDDYMLHAIAENGGLVMVNSWALFLDEAYADQSARFAQKYGAHLKELAERLPGDTQALREEIEKLWAQEGRMTPSLSRIIDHIEHAVKIAGIDHVALGSVFEGGDVLQEGLAGFDGPPNIALELIRRGYSDEDILRLLGGNFVRVLEQAEAYADSTETTLSGNGSTRQLSAAELRDLPAPPQASPPSPSSPPPPSRGPESWGIVPPSSPQPLRPVPRPSSKAGAPEPPPSELMLSR